MTSRLRVDGAVSTVRVRTRAIGLLARFAHDLELVVRDFRGEATEEGGAWTAELKLPVAEMRVAGVLRGDALDRDVLSASERAEIERKIRTDVLGHGEVSATASGASRGGGEAEVAVRGGSERVSVALRVSEDGERLRVAGEATVRLSALRIAEIKGPLGAFKVRDDVEVSFLLVLHRAG